MARRHAWIPFLTVACCLLAMAVGCGGPAPPPPKHDIHIRVLWHLYFEYMSKAYKAEGIDNPAELKQWAEDNIKPERMKKLAVYDLEAAFISPRDNLPYVLRKFNKSQDNGGVIIHEAKGVNGKKFVAYGRGGLISELNEKEFKAAIR